MSDLVVNFKDAKNTDAIPQLFRVPVQIKFEGYSRNKEEKKLKFHVLLTLHESTYRKSIHLFKSEDYQHFVLRDFNYTLSNDDALAVSRQEIATFIRSCETTRPHWPLVYIASRDFFPSISDLKFSYEDLYFYMSFSEGTDEQSRKKCEISRRLGKILYYIQIDYKRGEFVIRGKSISYFSKNYLYEAVSNIIADYLDFR
jgi:hypothetical protein